MSGATVEIDSTGPHTKVEQIRGTLAARIESGVLRAGVRMPSVRALARQARVSTLTVADAYNRLVAAGYLDARPGSGYFVLARPERISPPRLARPPVLPLDTLWMLRRIYESDAPMLNAACGWLPETFVFGDGIRAALGALARKPVTALAHYGHPRGYAPLRQHVRAMLATRGIEASADQIVMTSGASQALDLVARCLLHEGDVALMDDPGYCNLVPVLSAMGVRAMGVPRTPDGPCIASLSDLVVRHRPRAFFTTTRLQNPTGTSCSPSAAYQLLRLADEFDFRIVEDDIFADLQQTPTPILASLDRLGRVAYIGSFSKSIAPCLRVGYVACDSALAESITVRKMTNALTTSELSERLVHAILVDGRLRAHLARLRERLEAVQIAVCDGLQDAGLVLFHRPVGGLFVWAGMPAGTDMTVLIERAAQHGILLAPGRYFHPDNRESPWLRFNAAHSNDARLFAFLRSAARTPTRGTLKRSG